MYESWLVLLPDEQYDVRTKFEQGQRDFHMIGSQLLDKVSPPLMFDDFQKEEKGQNAPIEKLAIELSEPGKVGLESNNPNAVNPPEIMDSSIQSKHKIEV